MSIVGSERDRRFQTWLHETPDIGEASPDKACAIKEKIATDGGIEESVARTSRRLDAEIPPHRIRRLRRSGP